MHAINNARINSPFVIMVDVTCMPPVDPNDSPDYLLALYDSPKREGYQ